MSSIDMRLLVNLSVDKFGGKVVIGWGKVNE